MMGKARVCNAGCMTGIIGGRNYVTNSSTGSWSSGSESWSDWITPPPNSSNRLTRICKVYPPDNMQLDDHFVFSAELEFDGVTAGSEGDFRTHFAGLDNEHNDWTNQLSFYGFNLREPPLNGVYKCVANVRLNTGTVNASLFIICIATNFWGSGRVRVRKAKFERGPVVSDWTANPYDILTRLAAIETKLGITYDPPMIDGPEMEEMDMEENHVGGGYNLYIVSLLPALIGGVRHG